MMRQHMMEDFFSRPDVAVRKVVSNEGKRMRRRPIELRASDGFGSMEPTPTKVQSWSVASGMCNSWRFWRHSENPDND
jgi:hypothetical protein